MRDTKLVKKARGILLSALAVFAMMVSCGRAELITIAIEADISAVSDPCGHLEGKISSGGFLTGYYIYDLSTLDTDPSPSTGVYWQSNPICGMFLSAGGFRFDTNAVDVHYLVGVENNLSSKDKYLVESFNNLDLSNGVKLGDMFWQLEDSTMLALDSDALPTDAPDLNAWDENYLYITGGPRGMEFSFSAEVTSVTVVPEPATIALISAGLCILRSVSA
jgi:hypothetical protein